MLPYEIFEVRLTWPEKVRATRWAGAGAVVIGTLANVTLRYIGVDDWVLALLTFCLSFGAMQWLTQREKQRALWRKWNSLEA